MTPDDLLDPRRWWYGDRFDALLACLDTINDIYDGLTPQQRRDLLEMALPCIGDIYGCWGELTGPLDLLAVLDGALAVSIIQDRGQFSGLAMDRADAYDRVRGEYIDEVRDVLRRHLTVVAPVGLAAVTG